MASSTLRTTFFTVAVGDYRWFAVPYAFSILRSNPDAAVEVMVDELDDFLVEYADALKLLDGPVLFREAAFSKGDAPYMRFLVQPRTVAPYVYIGDVDILVLDSGITDTHIANAGSMGLPYSNILRPAGDRLSGLHFTEWDAYYPIEFPPLSALQNFIGDEKLLKMLVERRGLGMPTGSFRPVHGIHMSPNRNSVILRTPGVPSWGVGEPQWRAYQAFAAATSWRQLLPLLHVEYQAIINRLETACIEAFDTPLNQNT